MPFIRLCILLFFSVIKKISHMHEWSVRLNYLLVYYGINLVSFLKVSHRLVNYLAWLFGVWWWWSKGVLVASYISCWWKLPVCLLDRNYQSVLEKNNFFIFCYLSRFALGFLIIAWYSCVHSQDDGMRTSYFLPSIAVLYVPAHMFL